MMKSSLAAGQTEYTKSLQYLSNKLKSLPALAQWMWYGTGPMTSKLVAISNIDCESHLRSIADAIGFLKAQEHGAEVEDFSSGPNSPDLEILTAPAVRRSSSIIPLLHPQA